MGTAMAGLSKINTMSSALKESEQEEEQQTPDGDGAEGMSEDEKRRIMRMIE